jgi:non-heme chloroperoxidase
MSKYGKERIHSVVFVAAVTPFLMQGADNPDGPLDGATATQFTSQLTEDRDGFLKMFTTAFFTANEQMVVSDAQYLEALALAQQADQNAALQTMGAWATTDFRDDLKAIDVPVLIVHGDADALVPFEGSGQRTHAAIPDSQLHVVAGGPHGLNVSHAEEFNQTLIEFLGV